MMEMQNSADNISRDNSNNGGNSRKSLQSLRRLSLCSQLGTGGGQLKSPIVFPEKRSKRVKASSKRNEVNNDALDKVKGDEHRIDIVGGDEKSDLLGGVVISGKLFLDKRKTSSIDNSAVKNPEQQNSADTTNQQAVDARLTSRALVWSSNTLHLDDIISVTYNTGVRYFTVHSYPLKKGSCGLSCFVKPKRCHKEFRFVAPTVEEAVQWVGAFADQQCYVSCLPHPLLSSKKQASSELLPIDTPPELLFKCKSPPKMLVILNPRSGHGRSSKVFNEIVEPIFKLAGFKLEIVKTTSAGHAKKLASTVDISSCPDGIICVGGDGIINEVLNGLLGRDNQKEGISIPIGIIPAGSDNSLAWTVLGIKDPVSAAIAIVKGGLTPTDVFAVEWIHTGVLHFGMTVSYYGFVSDVLELSEKHQKRFGPLRYFVAGFLKFLCLPKYSYEVEYLPAREEGKQWGDREVVDVQDLYTDIMRRSNMDGIPRASSLSSIDSIMTPSRMSGGELEACSSTHASTEPSEFVRGIDPKAKRLSSGRNNVMAEAEVIHPQLPLSTTPNWPRTRSKSRNDKWTGLTATHDSTRCSWGNTASDREDISSTLSDPGPIWDAEPKWDPESNWDAEHPIELPGPPADIEAGTRRERERERDIVPRFEDKWECRKGKFLGVLVCNHACRSVQSSQVVAPKAAHDDNTMDLILVHGSGRLRLIRFFFLLQMGKGQHLSLPYVEYIKVKSVKVKAGKHTHNSCGIDGELFALNGQVVSSLLPEQCRLIGRSPTNHI